MATTTIKQIPDPLYGQLKALAAAHRRSVNAEMIVCLELAVRERAHRAYTGARESLESDGRLTLAAFEDMGGEGVHELVGGRLVREPQPGFRHGRIVLRLGAMLMEHVAPAGLGEVCVESGFLLVEEPPTVRGPDVAFIAADRLPPDGPPSGFWPGAPDLAVEVVSPGDRAAEVQAKVWEYLDAGARLVWVVYPDLRTVAIHEGHGSARFVGTRETLDGGVVVPGLSLDVSALFD